MIDEAPPSGAPARLAVPVNEPDTHPGPPDDGIGLALSGGGFRAMLFHLGTLWRLYDADALAGIARISSVSGGSITSAVLALAWSRLSFNATDPRDFVEHVVKPIRAFADRTVDVGAVLRGIVLPGSIADKVAGAYRKHLFGTATLQHFPDSPRFVINASNLQTAALWRFSKPYMGDWRTGLIDRPDLQVAIAVAASSAFPPILSPMHLKVDPTKFRPDTSATLQHPPFTEEVILSDGGVYDNLGLETIWKRYRTVLVSDAGMKIAPDGKPHTDWVRGAMRVADIVDSQVRSLRNRQLMASFAEPPTSPNFRKGAYWSARSDLTVYPAPEKLACPFARTSQLAITPTRLAKIDAATQERLINWGYASCDAAIRSYLDPALPPPSGFPYPIGV
ncbi:MULTISPECIES: patatin-like phospholipase family protein [unclassified Novosphingobium]|uniref:patatin-like phospholipase family protein n=1 Tax=unclassified Novosphingobium TaxID=2644732 RepID=UPI00146CC5C0|nr:MULTISPECIES: patatin-like phospholipase family protein [unclassified Novosphingobium]NMN06746.1 NTE family protein [Novosphingobium sp. SG919]NMN88803.1 NTE family protein [Novosphingobium sp. SG916]